MALTAGIIGLASLLAYTFLLADHRSRLNVSKDKLTISTVSTGPFEDFIAVTGVVQPLKTIRLDAIAGGYVTQKLVEGGSMVQAGDVLLRLENQNLTSCSWPPRASTCRWCSPGWW